MPRHRSFDLGTKGVNVRDSPLHLTDGEFVAAQNAELSRDEMQDGLVKRGGIELFTTAVLESSVLGFTSVPLPDPFPTFARLVALDPGSFASARVSSTGASWANLAGPSAVNAWDTPGVTQSLPHFDGAIYYPISACAGLQAFDGVGVSAKTPWPQTITVNGSPTAIASIVNAVVKDGFIWWLVNYSASAVVLKHDPSTGTYTQIATPFVGPGGVPGTIEGTALTIDVWLGQVYVQVFVSSTFSAAIYRCDPSIDTTWTLEETQSDTGIINPTGIASDDLSALYAGYGGGGGVDFTRLRKRTAAGVWSTVINEAVAGTCAPVYVAEDRVLAWVRNSTNTTLRESTNGGGSFSTVFTDTDANPAGSGGFARLVRFKGLEFLQYADIDVGVGRTIRNNAGWGSVDTIGSSNGAAGLLSGVPV